MQKQTDQAGQATPIQTAPAARYPKAFRDAPPEGFDHYPRSKRQQEALTPETPPELDVVQRVEAVTEPGAVPPSLPTDLEAVDLPDERRVVLIRKVACPYCGAPGPRCYGAYGRVRYYECRRCVFPDGSGQLTRFKGIVE